MKAAISLVSSLEYICPHEPQKPAVFAAAALQPRTIQATAKATKAKAGSNTNLDNPVISAATVRSGTVSARVS